MIKSSNKKQWFIWLVGTLALLAFLGYSLLLGKDKTVFMPGELTSGHHQIGVACESCHTSEFNDKKDFQEACESCHADVRKKPFDSHPKAKFKDPRNADLLEKIDALHCIGCHTEHKPEKTHEGGYTQPKDYCIHCHEDVGENRPTHKGMDFMTCNNSGCHNYHNNQALYTDFLLKHMHEPALLDKTQLPLRDYGSRLSELMTYPHDKHPVEPQSKADAPTQHQSKDIEHDWLTTSHAKAGVNCQACHMQSIETEQADGSTVTTEEWKNSPDQLQVCSQCHDLEVEHFQRGKHGMRLKAGLSPMTPAMARLPMQPDSKHKELLCTTCHTAHQFDTQEAAVDTCLTCHADEHSLAYKDSPHYGLWQKEQSGDLAEGQGVSCASCHMPRIDMDINDWMSRVVVMHNQNAALVPREKMIRPACLHCHGLEFSINAINDETLINNNFQGQPTFKTDSFRLAEEDEKRHQDKQAND